LTAVGVGGGATGLTGVIVGAIGAIGATGATGAIGAIGATGEIGEIGVRVGVVVFTCAWAAETARLESASITAWVTYLLANMCALPSVTARVPRNDPG
jgi:hypothetical protein